MDFLKEAFNNDPAKTWLEEIEAWKKAAAEARAREIDLNVRVAELDYEKSQLELKVIALVRLLIDSEVIDSKRLESMMAAIDAEDGFADGRITPESAHRSPFTRTDH